MRALYGRIMRMGMVRITRMGALCVRKWGSGRSRKRPQKRGCAAYGEISPKKKSVNEKKEIKKS